MGRGCSAALGTTPRSSGTRGRRGPSEPSRDVPSAFTSEALSEDGSRVLTGSDENTAILWDTELLRPLQTFKGHAERVTSVALGADGKRVLTGSVDKTAILWNAETGKPIRTFKGHNDWVRSVALSLDGTRVLTGSDDWTAILWDIETARPLQTFKGLISSRSSAWC